MGNVIKTFCAKFVTAVAAVAVVVSSFLFSGTAHAATPAENQRTYASQIAELYELIDLDTGVSM